VPFDGPSSASKAAFEALADVYRTELMPFGVAVRDGAGRQHAHRRAAKTAAALKRIADAMTEEQTARSMATPSVGSTDSLNSMQNAGLSAEASADRVIELVEQVPPPIRAALGDDAEQILRLVQETVRHRTGLRCDSNSSGSAMHEQPRRSPTTQVTHPQPMSLGRSKG